MNCSYIQQPSLFNVICISAYLEYFKRSIRVLKVNIIDSISVSLRQSASVCHLTRLFSLYPTAALDDIDVARLDALEANLNDAEAELRVSNIDVRYTKILLARDEQYYLRNVFLTDLDQLRDDVENIRIINETIPRECFREIAIEPVRR